MVGILAVLIGQTALAIEPLTAPNLRRIEWEWQEGREPETLVIKFSEESGIIWDGEQLVNLPKEWSMWAYLLSDVQPRFSKSSYALEAKRRKYDSEGRLSDLRTYVVLEGQEFQGFAQAVENDHRIEHMYLAYSAQPPPIDIPPETPSFVEEQGYLAEALGGFDTNYAKLWPEQFRTHDEGISNPYHHHVCQNFPLSTLCSWQYTLGATQESRHSKGRSSA